MWTFLKMLFLGGTTVLTLHPIDIDEAWVVALHVKPDKKPELKRETFTA
jgi:hypothetical protein